MGIFTRRLVGLNDFEAAARHGNFHRAAAELCKTPAAVSIQIKQLEAAIGLALFVRHARRVELTECGRELAATVSRSLVQIEEKIRELQREDSDVLVRVSSTHSFSLKWLAPRLPGLARQHPQLDVRVLASDELVDVDAGECDVALRHAPVGSGDALFKEWLVPVISPSIGCNSLAEACQLPLLHEGDTSLWEEFLESRLGDRHYISCESRRLSHAGLLVQAACAGGGVALVPFSIACEDIRQGRLVVIPSAPMRASHDFQVVTGRSPLRPAVAAFLEWAREEAREMESEIAGIVADRGEVRPLR